MMGRSCFSSVSARYRWGALLVVLCSAWPVDAQAQLTSKSIEGWQQAQQTERIVAQAREARRKKASRLSTIEMKLVRAALEARLVMGKLSGEEGALTMRLPVIAAGNSVEKAAPVLAQLGAMRGKDVKICITMPSGATLEQGLAAETQKAALNVLGVDADAIRIRRQLEFKVQGRTVTATPENTGKTLFDVVWQTLKTKQPMTLTLSPAPNIEPVRLELRTTKGETITVPATINGASRDITLAPNSEWKTNTGARIAFDGSKVMQSLLLGEVIQSGIVRLSPRARKEVRPIAVRKYGRARSLVAHALDAAGQWYASTTFLLAAKAETQRGSGECAYTLKYSFAIDGGTSPTLGPLSLDDWRKVTRLVITEPNTEKALIGYLDPPWCGESLQLAGKERPIRKRRRAARSTIAKVEIAEEPKEQDVAKWHIDFGAGGLTLAATSVSDADLGFFSNENVLPLLHVRAAWGEHLRPLILFHTTPGAAAIVADGDYFDLRAFAGLGYAFMPFRRLELEPHVVAGFSFRRIAWLAESANDTSAQEIAVGSPAFGFGGTTRFFFIDALGVHADVDIQVSSFPETVGANEVVPVASVSTRFGGGLSLRF